MERTNYRMIFLLFIFLSAEVEASFSSEIYYAYINSKMEVWKNVIDRMDALKGKSNKMLLELVNYQYGYIAYCIGNNYKDEAKIYLDLALKNIDFLEKQKYELSIINAYKSAFYGFRMSINKLFTPVMGIKSIESAKSAIELDKENYFGYVQLGNIEFYMPSAFGGSKKEALNYYLKAKELIEHLPENISENWNYLSLLTVIGQSYYYLNDYDSAKEVYEKILALEPGFLYVKNELYPQLLKKMEDM
jgi:tetratricopeptide (TPR) repeat protein